MIFVSRPLYSSGGPPYLQSRCMVDVMPPASSYRRQPSRTSAYGSTLRPRRRPTERISPGSSGMPSRSVVIPRPCQWALTRPVMSRCEPSPSGGDDAAVLDVDGAVVHHMGRRPPPNDEKATADDLGHWPDSLLAGERASDRELPRCFVKSTSLRRSVSRDDPGAVPYCLSRRAAPIGTGTRTAVPAGRVGRTHGGRPMR